MKGIIQGLIKDGHKPDILLNCAGIQRRHVSEKFPDEDWDEVCWELLLAAALPFC